VAGQERLQHHPSADVACAHETGGTHDERHRLLARPVARRQQLGVEIQERHDVSPADTVQHGLRADVDVGVGGNVAVVAADDYHVAIRGGSDLLSQAGDSRAKVGERRAHARRAHEGPIEAAAVAVEVAGIVLSNSGLASLAAGERFARATRRETSPALCVVDAHDPAALVTQCGDERRREHRRLPRLVPRAIDDVDERPRRP